MPNITTNHAFTYTNRPNIFPEILKKRLNIPQIFLNISKNPRNFSYFCFKKKPILNLLGQNFPKRELKSMFRLIYVSSDMEYIIRVENRWTGLFLAEYSVKKIARKSWKTAKKAINLSEYPINF